MHYVCRVECSSVFICYYFNEGQATSNNSHHFCKYRLTNSPNLLIRRTIKIYIIIIVRPIGPYVWLLFMRSHSSPLHRTGSPVKQSSPSVLPLKSDPLNFPAWDRTKARCLAEGTALLTIIFSFTIKQTF